MARRSKRQAGDLAGRGNDWAGDTLRRSTSMASTGTGTTAFGVTMPTPWMLSTAAVRLWIAVTDALRYAMLCYAMLRGPFPETQTTHPHSFGGGGLKPQGG